jgi:Raf kinase inhibitor-like YbhB/YbcL family protein
MKKILVLIVLSGFISFSGHAQSKSCVCVKKTAHHKLHSKKTIAKSGVDIKRKQSIDTTPLVSLPTWSVFPALNGCIVDSNGDFQSMTATSFTGNYPSGFSTDCDINSDLKTGFSDMVITSSAFTNNGLLPAKYTCMGQAASPPLNITNIPEGAASLAIIMFDPHATATKSRTNWLIWNVDTDGRIPENFATDYQSDNAVNHDYGYAGACPISGTHYYHIRAYALDAKLRMDKHATRAVFENVIKDHVLSKGEIVVQSNKNIE